jgi:hypothetical protein
MKFFLFHLLVCAVLVAVWIRSDEPVVDALVMLFGFRHAVVEAVDAAKSEFASVANAPGFCALNARVEKGVPAWVEDRDGQYSMRLSRFGASSKVLLKTRERPPELRLVPLVGEQQMFRMRLSDCSAKP